MTWEGEVGELSRVKGRPDCWVAEEGFGALTENVGFAGFLKMYFYFCILWPFYIQLEEQQGN